MPPFFVAFNRWCRLHFFFTLGSGKWNCECMRLVVLLRVLHVRVFGLASRKLQNRFQLKMAVSNWKELANANARSKILSARWKRAFALSNAHHLCVCFNVYPPRHNDNIIIDSLDMLTNQFFYVFISTSTRLSYQAVQCYSIRWMLCCHCFVVVS